MRARLERSKGGSDRRVREPYWAHFSVFGLGVRARAGASRWHSVDVESRPIVVPAIRTTARQGLYISVDGLTFARVCMRRYRPSLVRFAALTLDRHSRDCYCSLAVLVRCCLRSSHAQAAVGELTIQGAFSKRASLFDYP